MNKTILRIGEQDFTIKFDINTLCMMTQAGIDILNMQETKIDLVFLRSLFYFGIKNNDNLGYKSITENKAGTLMGEYLQEGNNFGDLMQIIMSAIAKSLGNNIDEEKVVEVLEEEDEEGK